jgi:hypothetical protein
LAGVAAESRDARARGAPPKAMSRSISCSRVRVEAQLAALFNADGIEVIGAATILETAVRS